MKDDNKFEVISGSDEPFLLDASIGAIPENSEKDDLLALEIDFSLKNGTQQIPKDSFVWMYTSFKNKGDTSVEESWETVSCMV